MRRTHAHGCAGRSAAKLESEALRTNDPARKVWRFIISRRKSCTAPKARAASPPPPTAPARSLHEEATGITHDYTRKRGVEHTEILAPEGAPAWVFDRQTLWNTVEAAEKRKDAQLAREIEVGLPIELTKSEQIALAARLRPARIRAKGMVADLGIHRDNPHNPHAHILLTTRDLTADGFGPKNRSWNAKGELLQWRRGWAEVTNEHLAEAGLARAHRSPLLQGPTARP